MYNKKYTLENIKNQAKKFGKIHSIKYLKALDIVSQNLGYANFVHLKRMYEKESVPFEQIDKEVKFLNFNEWLAKQKNRDSPLGDLSKDMLRTDNWPLYDNLSEYKSFLFTLRLPWGASRALENAWKSYQAYISRCRKPKKTTSSISSAKAKTPPYPRRIVHIKDATYVNTNERSVEEFKIGDPAWISWGGRKAIPVTVVGRDERNYSVRLERPLKDSGDICSLYLDEVRSTPHLACANYVS